MFNYLIFLSMAHAYAFVLTIIIKIMITIFSVCNNKFDTKLQLLSREYMLQVSFSVQNVKQTSLYEYF